MWNVLKRYTDWWIAAGLAIAAFLLYGSTVAPSVLMADGGEFQFVAPLAGIAHPTGYPFYLSLGWIWTRLFPFGSPAFKMNVFSAFTGALAIAVLYLTIGRAVRLAGFAYSPSLNRGVAVIIASLVAISRTFWSQAIIAEVYMLNALLVTCSIYFLLRWVERGTQWTDLIPLAIVFGLGLAHHRTIVLLLLPIAFAIAVVERTKRASRLRDRHILLLVGIMLLPLLLYLYIPLRAPHSPYLTIPLNEAEPLTLYRNDLQGFVDYVLGRSFEGSLRLSLLSVPRLQMAFNMLRLQFSWLGILLGLVGLGWLLFGWRWILLTATVPAYAMLLGFNLIYDIGDIAVLFIPTYLIWALWMAAGLAWFCRQAGQVLIRWKGSPARARASSLYRRLSFGMQRLAGWLILSISVAWPIVLLTANLPAVSRREDWSAWSWWQRILAQPLPAGAVLISNDRDEIMPLWYLQHIEGRRPDLIGLFPRIVEGSPWDNVGAVIDQALESGRPVYLIKPMPGLAVKFALAPAQAGMVQVIGPAVTTKPARETQIVLGDAIRLVGYDHSPYSVKPGQELTVTVYWQPLVQLERNYSSFVQLLDRAGNRVVGSDHQPGGDYYPTSLWRPGEMLRDVHYLIVPTDLTPGAYQFYAGLYSYPSMERLGDAKLGYVGVKTRIETTRRVPPHPMELYFEDKILFLGYELRKEGQSILLTLEWEALREMEYDYTTFVHLVDSAGQFVSQADSQPLGGTYPTSIWDRGEVIIDGYRLPIEVDTPPGEYRLLIGLYRLETLERLNIFDAQGNPLGNFVELQKVTWP